MPYPLKIVLSVDIGTSSLKAALIDGDGHGRGFVRVLYPPLLEGETRPAGDWEAALARALADLAREQPELRPSGICISGNGPTLVPVNTAGEALSPLHWYDRRTIPEGKENGQPSLFLPKAAWFREKVPGLYEKTKYLFSSQEWLSWRLGSEPVTVLAWDAYKPYYWDEAGGQYFKVDQEKFPPFVPLGSVIGRTDAAALHRLAASTRTGWPEVWLTAGTPIVAGGPDFIAALCGTGVLEPGLVADRAGSSEGVNLCLAGLPEEKGGGLRFLPGAMAGLWNAGALIPSSGQIFERYREITGQTGRTYEELLAEIEALPLTADAPFFFPNPVSGNGFYGGLGHPHPAELGRAVTEAIGFLAAEAMDSIEGQGFVLGEPRLSGGQCKSGIWNQLKADITGRPLLLPEIPDGELAGDALAAFFALGDYSSLKEAAARMIRIRTRYEPRPDRAALYAERRAKYKEQSALNNIGNRMMPSSTPLPVVS